MHHQLSRAIHDARSGIAAFLSKHQCNPICEHLRIGNCVDHKFGMGTLAPTRPTKPAASGGFKQSPQAAKYANDALSHNAAFT